MFNNQISQLDNMFNIMNIESHKSVGKFNNKNISKVRPGEYVTFSKSGEIKITKVFNKSFGAYGNCWEVFATAKSKPDVEFAIPACWVNHNPDVWVKPKKPWNQKKAEERLRIDTEFLEEVRCSF